LVSSVAMTQVTCGACGAVQQLADAEVPPGGKTISCTSCKSRIQVPGTSGARSAALPDLPAPRRPSPLAGAGPAKPAPPSPLAAAAADLPAPKSARPSVPDLPAPRSPFADLPAPKSAIPDLPAPRLEAVGGSASAAARIADATDLPAPKRTQVPIPPPIGLPPPDLVTPKRSSPAIPAMPPDRPAIGGHHTTSGIAPPRTPARPISAPGDIDLDDLLAPTGSRTGGLSDLPAPRRAESELPAPKRPSHPAAELPAPKRASAGVSDLLQPVDRGSTDLPAPKGFFDDLPQPARAQGSTDLPAPKGFFDDLPQPAKAGKPELPAPKGFFDDLPQRARNQSGLPQPVAAAAAVAAKPIPGNRNHTPSVPPPTADDLFNDLTPPPVMTTPPALDLDDLDLGVPGEPGPDGQPRPKSPSTSGIRASRPHVPTAPPPSGTRSTSDTDAEAVPLLDLGEDADRADFAKVELPAIISQPNPGASGVSFKASKGSAPGLRQEPMSLGGAADLALDVEETKAPQRRKRSTSLKPPKAEARPGSVRRTRIALLVVLLLAGGGYLGFRWWKQHQRDAALQAELKDKMVSARASLLAADPGHWKRALTEAGAVFAASSKDGEAAGIAAQAAYASAFEEDPGAEQRIKQGTMIVNKALGNALSGGELDKAQALKLVLDGQPQRALERYLDPLVKRAPKDANAALYQGWARLAIGDAAGAVDAFDRAGKALPKRDLPAVYGRGRARLLLGDRAAARADFTAVLARDKAHVGAQVGLAETAMTPGELAQREKDLIALLDNTKTIDQADPRVVALAYTIIGDDARRGSRLDAARDRYRKAAAKAPLDSRPLRGQAELALREDKLDDAAAAIDKALKLAPDDLDVNLVAGEIALRQDKPDEVEARITKVRDKKPVNPWQKARLFVLTGRWHESQKRTEDALAAYEDALAVANEADLETPLTVAGRLGTMADADPARATELRARATKLLAPIEDKAGAVPSIAIALGVGYLAAGDPARAEAWLRKAVAAAKDNDEIDARFQLAEALARQHKTDEALAMLQSAFDRDDSRLDVGLQLALRYEQAGRLDDASLMYDKMLPKPDVTIDLRGRAGRFYARRGLTDKARQQGEEILKLEATHPTGLFLRGIGLFATGKLEDARRVLQQACDTDPDPQFLDALARVNESLWHDTNDPRNKDAALRAYTEAAEADPTLLSSLTGMGRLLLDGRVAQKALDAFTAAYKLAPKDPDIQYSIGIAYQLLGKAPEALAWMKRSLAVKPRPDGFFNVGNMHYDAGELAPAAAALARATELGAAAERAGAEVPWLTDAYYMLGASELDLHHDAAAVKALQAYIDRDPKDQVKVDKVKRDILGRSHVGAPAPRRRHHR